MVTVAGVAVLCGRTGSKDQAKVIVGGQLGFCCRVKLTQLAYVTIFSLLWERESIYILQFSLTDDKNCI